MVFTSVVDRIFGNFYDQVFVGNDLSAALDDIVVEHEEAKQRYTDAANEIIKRFGLAGYVPEPPKSVAAAA